MPEEALAAFYAYESQVPRVAQEKARGTPLESMGADGQDLQVFRLHNTADVHHAASGGNNWPGDWKQNPQVAEPALSAGGKAAKALWTALDGTEARRIAHAA